MVTPYSIYLLNHSVGKPVDTAFKALNTQFEHWQHQDEPWPLWLESVDHFRSQLARFMGGEASQWCPQTNLSGALTKLLFSIPRPSGCKTRLLLSEDDFPSMVFVAKQAESLGYQLTFIPKGLDLSLFANWEAWIKEDTALVFISHVQSNTGRQLPVDALCQRFKENGTYTIVDVAQSAGILPINVMGWQADAVIGSCVKWLGGGPGAGYLWLNPQTTSDWLPQDVGWFSHDNPFEFDPHHFQYRDDALRFWGGTPSVWPYTVAAAAIAHWQQVGVERIRAHNLELLALLRNAMPEQWWVSPVDAARCSGTAIIHAGEAMDSLVEALTQANVAFDRRDYGLRLSPHWTNNKQEIADLAQRIEQGVAKLGEQSKF